ncbi:predicted protein [Sparassis crispa]|uniref:TERF2-interacting telomeric protein 1 Myb domain-containing protein n=1 Tax=Sparassis crispa TaxID=139825 RepID=A0A401GL28_9APHY|nr:predicted protein [Sparassis crispa]GBE82877.1 predicted protein [Sparassis crispa]
MPGSISRVSFTKQDDAYLVLYLAKYTADGKRRHGNDVYKELVANRKGMWRWSERHTWQSWREHYVRDTERFDRYIAKKQSLSGSSQPSASQNSIKDGRHRHAFTEEDDTHLVKYIAKHGDPGGGGRMGNNLYKYLVGNPLKWPWAPRHPWESWRERYKNHRDKFDQLINRHHKKYGVGPFSSPTKAERGNAVKEEEEEDDDRLLRIRRGRAPAPVEDESAEASARDNSKRKMKRRREDGGEHAIRGGKRRRVDNEEAGQADEHIQVEAPAEAGNGAAPRVQDDSGKEINRGKHNRDEEAEEADAELVEQVVAPEAGAEAEREDDEEDNDAEHRRVLAPPPSDDYNGEIFDRPDDGAAVGVDAPQWKTIPSDPEDELGSDAENDEEVDELPNEPYDGVDHVEDQQPLASAADEANEANDADLAYHNQSAPAPSAPRIEDSMLNGRLYPDVPSPPHSVQAEPLIPGTFPGESTPVAQARPSRAASGLPDAARPSLPHEVSHGIAQAPSSPDGVPERTPVRSAASSQRTIQRPTKARPAPPPESVLEESATPRPPTAPGEESRARSSGEPGPSATVFAMSTPRLRKKVRVPAILQPDFFTSLSTTPSEASRRARSPVERRRMREPPRLDEGAYNKAFTDSVGRRRVSLHGRVYGVEEQDLDDLPQEEEQDISWPPKRDRKGKGKEREKPMFMEKTVRTTMTVKQEVPNSQPLFAQPNGSRFRAAGDSDGHHPFSQVSAASQEMISPRRYMLKRRMAEQQKHHPFSQVNIPVTSTASAASISAALDAFLNAEVSTAPHQPDVAPTVALLSDDDLRYLDEVLNNNAELLEQELEEPYVPERGSRISSAAASAGSRPTERLDSSPGGNAPSGSMSPAGSVVQEPSTSLDVRPHRADEVAEVTQEEQEMQPAARLRKQLHRRRYTLPANLGNHSNLHLQAGDSRDDSVPQAFQPFSSNMEWLARNPLVRDMYQQGTCPPFSLEDMCGITAVVLQSLSKAYGFTEDVVLEKWTSAGSLSIAERWLAEMRQGAEQVSVALEDSMVLEEDDPSERRQSGLHAHPAVIRLRRSSRRARPSHSKNSSVLQITPLPNEAEYQPHPDSRAGQYVRLTRAARREDVHANENHSTVGSFAFRVPRRRSTNGEKDDRDVEKLLDGERDDMEIDSP